MTKKLQALFTNFGWKVVAVAIAAGLWWLLLREPELVAVRMLPVLLKRPPADLVLAANPGPVQVELAGPVSLLEETQFRGAAVVLDLGGVREPGERTFTLTAQDIDLPTGATFRRVVPSQLQLRFETRVRREVPVRLRVGTPPAAAFRLLEPQLDPAAVTVSGPGSRVAALAFVETDPVDLGGLSGETRLRAAVALGDPHLTLEGVTAVVVTVKVAPARAQ